MICGNSINSKIVLVQSNGTMVNLITLLQQLTRMILLLFYYKLLHKTCSLLLKNSNFEMQTVEKFHPAIASNQYVAIQVFERITTIKS